MTSAGVPVARSRVFDGWFVVGAVSVVLLVAGGLGFYGLSVYLKELKDARGFSVGWISGATSLFFVIGGLAGPAVARVIERRDVRLVIAAGGIVAGIALALLGQVQQLWQLYLVDALLAVGNTCCFLVPCTTVVTRWFHRRRSVALSIASTGISMGGLVFTPLASALIGHLGIATASVILGAVWTGVVVPTATVIWPDPASRGEWPDGDEPAAVSSTGAVAEAAGVPYEEAIHSRFFRVVVIAYVFGLTAQVGALIHLYNRVSDDAGKGAAGAAVLCVALSSVVFRLLGGVVAERVPLRRLTVTMFVIQGVSLAILAGASSAGALLAGSVLFGATIGNTLMLQPLLIAEAFGVRDYARIYSLNLLWTTLGVAGGPFVLGVIHDVTGGYTTAYVVAAILSVVGAMSLASRRRESRSSSTMAWAASK
ncbi:MAG TPA: MFS transporter [Acidimicrobiales bacterium]